MITLDINALSKRLLVLEKLRNVQKKMQRTDSTGEADNAKAVLERTMQKYGITWEELEDTQMQECRFPFKGVQHRDIIYACICSVVNDYQRIKNFNAVSDDHDKLENGELLPMLTIAENLEIREKINWYWTDYKEQENIFRMAYIRQNELTYDLPLTEQDNISDDVLQKMLRAEKMKGSIQKTTFRKSLGE